MVAKRAVPKGRIKAFAVEPEVTINNQWSNRYTVVEVTGLDRPGLLYELTATLSKLNLNIASAHVATFGERVVDVFYVTDLLGAKIASPTRQAAIKRALVQLFAIPATAAPKPAKATRSSDCCLACRVRLGLLGAALAFAAIGRLRRMRPLGHRGSDRSGSPQLGRNDRERIADELPAGLRSDSRVARLRQACAAACLRFLAASAIDGSAASASTARSKGDFAHLGGPQRVVARNVQIGQAETPMV